MGDVRRKLALIEAQTAIGLRHPVGRMIANEKDVRLSRSRLQKLEGGFVHPHSIARPRVDRDTRLRDTLSMRFTAALGMLAALTLLVSPAHAALSICNQTAKPTRVAVGHFDGTAWMS